MVPNESPGRSVAREITIDAPVRQVWNALVDPIELVRWFPLEARVDPGVGGTIWARWRDGIGFHAAILDWEPEHRLRIVGREGYWLGIATDYQLRGRGGSTVLRVVSSGFGAGENWDELVDGFGSGWDFELMGLKHYLERHRGRDRLVASARSSFASSRDVAWRRLTGPEGWAGSPGAGNGSEGSAYRTTLATGDELSGRVLHHRPGRQFVGTVTEWNDALLRLELFQTEVTVWLSAYGVPAGEVHALEARWQAALTSVFTPTST